MTNIKDLISIKHKEIIWQPLQKFGEEMKEHFLKKTKTYMKTVHHYLWLRESESKDQSNISSQDWERNIWKSLEITYVTKDGIRKEPSSMLVGMPSGSITIGSNFKISWEGKGRNSTWTDYT